MKPYRWNPEKNDLLKRERGVSFESMVVAIDAGGLLDVLAHPNEENTLGSAFWWWRTTDTPTWCRLLKRPITSFSKR